MNAIRRLIDLGFVLLIFSCTVTNNLYVNDPVPTKKGEGQVYLGLGTGVRAEIESVDDNGNINFSDDLTLAPNLSVGAQGRIIDNLDFRIAMHLPYIIGGFGLRAGAQYSFFKDNATFNMAVGTDLGFVVAKDSLKFLGTTSALEIYANGGINADFFMPISYSFNDNTRIIITPRFSFNTIYIRKNTNDPESFKFKPNLPSLALGLRTRVVYFEISAFRFQDTFFPNFGIVYLFRNKGETEPAAF